MMTQRKLHALVSNNWLVCVRIGQERVMAWFATFCKWGARAIFFALIIIQSIVLPGYLAIYKNNSHWFVLTTSFAPALIVWFCLIATTAKLRRLFYVWDLYIIFALLPNIYSVFLVLSKDDIDKNKLLSPNVIKLVLCITPLLFLLLLHIADDSDQTDEHRELVSKLSYRMGIDLFDAVDMIGIYFEDIELDFGIPHVYRVVIISMACGSLFLSTWQLAHNELARGTIIHRQARPFSRIFMEIVFVNLPFLIIRGVIFIKYGKDESIFIAKNVIGIILSVLEIRQLCVSRQ